MNPLSRLAKYLWNVLTMHPLIYFNSDWLLTDSGIHVMCHPITTDHEWMPFRTNKDDFYTWLDIWAVKCLYYFPKSGRYNILVTTIDMPTMPGSSLCPPTIHRGDTLRVGNNETFVEKLCFIERKLPVITHLQLPTHRAFTSLGTTGAQSLE